jgi:TonB family protein
MGRTGLRAVLRWCLCFCAALATASIPVASAQTHAPKLAPPVQNSALSPAKETPPPATPSPEETSDPAAKPPAASPVGPPAVPDAAFTPADGLPLAGERGITHPVCLQCPPALYSYPALLKRVQGNVTMDAIISKDGFASDVKILGSLGSGLDEQAMKAVRTWQWKPAQDANGNPVVAHQTVVITFRLPK